MARECKTTNNLLVYALLAAATFLHGCRAFREMDCPESYDPVKYERKSMEFDRKANKFVHENITEPIHENLIEYLPDTGLDTRKSTAARKVENGVDAFWETIEDGAYNCLTTIAKIPVVGKPVLWVVGRVAGGHN